VQTPAQTIRTGPRGAQSLRHHLTILVVIAQAEFKLKYAGSALGYLWSVLKPLALFTMMYLVFGRIFKLGAISQYYPLALLIGVVLFTFFSDANLMGMNSLVSRESLLRKLIFPRVIIPTAATLTAAMTFAVNTIVVAGFVAWNQLVPQLDWLLIIPLLLELYVFVLGIALILSTLFVRFRDIGQIWELVLQVFFYASPIIYPIGYLPPWARNIAFLNPFTQVLQGIRALIIYPEDVTTATTALGAYGSLTPIGVAFATLAIGLWLFKQQEPFFAERV
jgi:ABC-2 type transport system permease protein